MITLEKLHSALKQSWIDETASLMRGDGFGLFAENEPAVGQCAVTSLIVQDYFGGEILNTIASAHNSPETISSHYFNIIDGEVVDFTRVQFRGDVIFSEPKPKHEGFKSTREYMLSHPSTVQRYELLKSKVELLLVR